MRLSSILSVLQAIAPERLAEPWDHVGLHVGDPARAVSRAMLCIDLTEPVLGEAASAKAGLIVAYHPPIFDALSAVTTLELKSRIILRAAERKIAIHSPHTALDAAEGGVNDWLADGLGAGGRRPIRPATEAAEVYKLVTFVPADAVDVVRCALSAGGAGAIGDYSQCSFSSAGEGTFLGGASTRPAIGRAGRLERVAELRLEMVCPRECVRQVVAALRRVHPYEEPAFDLYPLVDAPAADCTSGGGRIITLDRPVSLSTLVRRIKAHLGVKHVEVAEPAGLGAVRRIGLCAGAGGSMLTEAEGIGDGIDVFFTGEMRHHDVLAARQRGVAVILAGHTQTERPFLPVLARRLKRQTPGVRWSVSRADRAPSALW